MLGVKNEPSTSSRREGTETRSQDCELAWARGFVVGRCIWCLLVLLGDGSESGSTVQCKGGGGQALNLWGLPYTIGYHLMLPNCLYLLTVLLLHYRIESKGEKLEQSHGCFFCCFFVTLPQNITKARKSQRMPYNFPGRRQY